MADVAADGDGCPGYRLARSIACPNGRGVTVTVKRVPGQAVTLTPVVATAAEPGGPGAGHAPQHSAGLDELDMFQVAADAAGQVSAAEIARPARSAGLGRLHTEHDADDRDPAARDRPDGGGTTGARRPVRSIRS